MWDDFFCEFYGQISTENNHIMKFCFFFLSNAVNFPPKMKQTVQSIGFSLMPVIDPGPNLDISEPNIGILHIVL